MSAPRPPAGHCAMCGHRRAIAEPAWRRLCSECSGIVDAEADEAARCYEHIKARPAPRADGFADCPWCGGRDGFHGMFCSAPPVDIGYRQGGQG